MNEQHYIFSGHDTVELANKYQTPLYVVSQDILEEQIDKLDKAFLKTGINYKINFAGKSFINKGLAKIIQNKGLYLDTASGGELYTALEAGFEPNRIVLHGNNKSFSEIELAIKNDIGLIVVDSLSELKRIQEVAESLGKEVDILIRVNPGVEAHTNELINTGKTDTKFGIPISEVNKVLNVLKDYKNLILRGFHSHIGSQIIEEKPFIEAAKKMFRIYKRAKDDGFNQLEELDLGGGFGIAYTKDEVEFDPTTYIPKLVKQLKKIAEENKIDLPIISVEPGRYISAPAGITLYEVGTIKDIPGIRTYLSVDGGLMDNPRPALYDAEYEAVICNRKLTNENKKEVRVSGKACETDTLINNIELADPQEGDILAIFKTGAYNYTMSSNYNRLPRPAVVLLKGNESDILVERESYEDVISHDRIPRWLK